MSHCPFLIPYPLSLSLVPVPCPLTLVPVPCPLSLSLTPKCSYSTINTAPPLLSPHISPRLSSSPLNPPLSPLHPYIPLYTPIHTFTYLLHYIIHHTQIYISAKPSSPFPCHSFVICHLSRTPRPCPLYIGVTVSIVIIIKEIVCSDKSRQLIVECL